MKILREKAKRKSSIYHMIKNMISGENHRLIDMQTFRHSYRQTYRQIDIQIGRHSDRQTGRHELNRGIVIDRAFYTA